MLTPREVYLERKIQQLESRLQENTPEFMGWGVEEQRLSLGHPETLQIVKCASVQIRRDLGIPLVVGRTYTRDGKCCETSIYCHDFLATEHSINALGKLLEEAINTLSAELVRCSVIYSREENK